MMRRATYACASCMRLLQGSYGGLQSSWVNIMQLLAGTPYAAALPARNHASPSKGLGYRHHLFG